MAVTEQRTLPAKFIEDLGLDLAKQITAQTAVPVVTTGIAGITQQPGETAAGFKARQDAARAFTTRQQNLAGLAPQVAQQDQLQKDAQTLALQGTPVVSTGIAGITQQAGETAEGFKARQDAARYTK